MTALERRKSKGGNSRKRRRPRGMASERKEIWELWLWLWEDEEEVVVERGGVSYSSDDEDDFEIMELLENL